MSRSVVFLSFLSFLWAQEEPTTQDTSAVQDSVSIQPTIYAVVVMSSQPLNDYAGTVEAPVLLDTLLDMPAEELMLIGATGSAEVIPTEKVMAAMAVVVGEDEICEDHDCARQVGNDLGMDKILLVDLSKVKASTGLDGEVTYSGSLVLSLTFLGRGVDIETGEEVELLVTEKTYSSKLKGGWEEFAVRVRSRTWRLMSDTPPEGRFPPEPFSFELSDLLLFIQDSPEIAILLGIGVLASLVGGYALASRPPVIGDPPPYPDTL